ncbi:hypothetical protein CTEN210_06213 [Chaetoceros tenuissimus]|uniref:Uncharacterized protein n=1 Tax=Chaetoceros tenuissimus TaxID=426638 RepID=A0AAD3CPF4_9STRA|nr:hypothetical protein CTEN210_06213 [Chaetoceros tenuissimus]
MKKKEREARPLLRASSTTATDEIPDDYTVATALVEEDIDVSEEENNDEEQQSLQSSNAKNQNAVPSLGTEKSPLGDPVHVILLLMDPKTRRFEILRLEFDAVAKVSDIYRHISASATEITLKSQEYNSLINLKSERLDNTELISTYIDSTGIGIAVPSSSEESPEAITKQATIILTNPKVQKLLQPNNTKKQHFELRKKKEPPATIVKVVKEEVQKAKTPFPHMGHKLQINSSAFTANDFECLQLDTGNWPSERVHCELQAGSEFIYDFVVEHFDDVHCQKPNAKLPVVIQCIQFEAY